MNLIRLPKKLLCGIVHNAANNSFVDEKHQNLTNVLVIKTLVKFLLSIYNNAAVKTSICFKIVNFYFSLNF